LLGLIDMQALEAIEILTPVTAAQIEKWIRLAWSDRSVFPEAAERQSLALHVNAIVSHHNVRSRRRASQDDLKSRIEVYEAAVDSADLLRANLESVKHDLQREHELLTNGEEGMPFHPVLEQQMSSIEALEQAIDNFRHLCPSSSKRDHMDPVQWIARGAEIAWKKTLHREQGQWGKTKGFGRQLDSPLTFFVQQVLEGMGMPHSDNLATIRDHLLGRHDRKRVR
jgi:hypothetical protein